MIFNSLNDIKKRDHFSDCYSHLSEQVLPVSYLKRGNYLIFLFLIAFNTTCYILSCILGSDELLLGRAGYVCGALILDKVLNNSQIVPTQVLQNLAVSTLKSGLFKFKAINFNLF